MSGSLEQLDPNYVVSFEYSKENVAKLVSEFRNHGIQTLTRPGHNSKTVYAFTRVDEPGVFEGGEAFSEKHPSKQPQPLKSGKTSHKSDTETEADTRPHDQSASKSVSSTVEGHTGNEAERKFENQNKTDSNSGPSDSNGISSEKRKDQAPLSDAEDTVKRQGGVQGLKDKASKVPGADKAEGDLKKKVSGGNKLGELGGASGLASSGSGSGSRSGAGAGKKGLADQAKGGLKGFNKDDVVKNGKEVFSSHKDELTEAGQKAAKGDTSGLEKAGTDVGKDVASRVDKDQLVSSGKKVFSSDKKDVFKNGKKVLAKDQAENKGEDTLSDIGSVGATGGLASKAGLGDGNAGGSIAKDSRPKGAKSSPGSKEFTKNTTGTSKGDKTADRGLKNDSEHRSFEEEIPGGTEGSLHSNAAVKGFPRESSASPSPRREEFSTHALGTGAESGAAGESASTGGSTKEPAALRSTADGGGGRAVLFAIVANFDFVQSVTPIYDAEKRKKLDATVNNLIRTPTLTPSNHDLTNLEHLTRNPREILYFFYFKNYILWLLPMSLVGVICRLFSRAVAPWEFNITYTFLLIAWSMLFASSWIYCLEPQYASKLGKVLGVVTPSEKKLSAPHVVLYKKLAFLPVALLFAVSLIAFQFVCFFIEIFITQLYSGPFSGVLALFPTVLISAVVPMLTLIYNKLFVDPLIKWENGPNPKKSKTEKNYILTFLTSYVPLLITLFVYLPLGHKFTPDLQGGVATYAKKYHIPVVASEFIVDVNRYKKQFFYYTVTAQIINMVLDNAVPLLLDILVPSLIKDGNRIQSDVVAKIDSIVQSRYPQDFDLWKKVQLYHASNYGEFDVDQNYSKLVVQFGYIAMFSIIWPLAPLIFTIFDLIIFRADLWRAFIKSKPSSNPSDLQVAKGGSHKIHVSSAPWNGILEKTTFLGFIVSVTLLLMYRYSNLPGVGLSTVLGKRGTWYRESPLVYSWPKILLAAVVAEHLALWGYLYVKGIYLSYQTKFEPATLPHVEVKSEPVNHEEIDETAAIMEEVAYEPVEIPNPKSDTFQKEGVTDGGASLNDPSNVFSAKSTGAEIHGSDDYPYSSNGDRSFFKGTVDDDHTRATGYSDGYRAGYSKGFQSDDENDGFASKDSAPNASNNGHDKDTSSGFQRRGYQKSGENGSFNDSVAPNDFSSGSAGKERSSTGDGNGFDVAHKTKKTHDSGANHNRSTKKTDSSSEKNGPPSDKVPKESSRYATSTKESNSSAQGNGKGFSTPNVVANSGAREIPVQSQGKNDLTSASAPKNPQTLNAAGTGAGAVAGATGGAGIADSGRASSTKQPSNREAAYLESPTPSEDAGATLPDTIPTSKNYDSRYGENSSPVRSAPQSEASPSASASGDSGNITGSAVGGGAAGGAASGLAAGAVGDFKSGKVPKGSGDVKKDVGSDIRSNKLPKGSDVGRDLKKDVPKDVGSDFTSSSKAPAGEGNDVSGTLSGTAKEDNKDSDKVPSVGNAMKTLDPAAVAGSAGNIAKDPSTAPQEAGNLAQQGAPVASAIWANRSKGVKGMNSQDTNEPASDATDTVKSSRKIVNDEGHNADAAQAGKYTPGNDVNEDVHVGGNERAASYNDVSDHNKGANIEDIERYNTKENIDGSYANKASGAARGAEKPTHGKSIRGTSSGREDGYSGADPESPAAQQFSRDAQSLKSGRTFGTAESKLDNLNGAAVQSEGAGTSGVSSPTDAGIQKTPQRSATKPKSDTTRPKSGTPSRSKTVGHSSQTRKEATNAKTPSGVEAPRGVSKDPKQKSSNPELRANQANSTPESKGKHKSGLLHKIIKKLE
ncbi:hypothetical protein ZYGM_004113 [Zygosaccharomyces mellis]|uniref:Anoctamin transmembrane domain-containing protein n=1 Tax=Zygosaccharomyces mellis TaxID=42258 RepID=A0A4C2E741_9SACH|nr:hypothetical protein ZYGM_004113 [Zygosaccharomyces mellis]